MKGLATVECGWTRSIEWLLGARLSVILVFSDKFLVIISFVVNTQQETQVSWRKPGMQLGIPDAIAKDSLPIRVTMKIPQKR